MPDDKWAQYAAPQADKWEQYAVQQQEKPAPPEQPGFAARASEQLGLTQHPIDQLIGELKQLKEHPVSTTWEAIKQPIVGLRDLANNLVRHPVDTVQQITGGKQFQQDIQSGNYAGAAGTLAGAAGQVALARGPQARISAPKIAETGAERIYQSTLKPPPGSYSTGEVASMVKTGLENEIPVSPAGLKKLDALTGNLQSQVKAQIAAGDQSGATINKFAVTRRLGDTAETFRNQVAPTTDLSVLGDVGNDFLETKPAAIPVQMAQDVKTGTYRQLKNKYGELSSARVESEKALARGIKEELEQQFPEIKGLNAQEGKLIGLDEALQRAVRRTSNHDIVSLGGKIVMSGAGAAVGSLGGAATGGAGALGALMLHHVMSDPALQSKLAIALSKASRGSLTVGGASAKIAGYSSALGRAVQPSADQSNTNTQDQTAP